jgi:hypothetical protein
MLALALLAFLIIVVAFCTFLARGMYMAFYKVKLTSSYPHSKQIFAGIAIAGLSAALFLILFGDSDLRMLGCGYIAVHFIILALSI